jgi:long-chain acyl-CoA synthetase
VRMQILDLLQVDGDPPILTSAKQSLSKTAFAARVEEYVEALSELPTDAGFVLVREEDPLCFYPLVFALWQRGNKVLFPNRDILAAQSSFPFFEYTVSVDQTKVVWQTHVGYRPLPAGANLPDADAIVFSSGSTGSPKGILHTKENFLVNAQAVVKKLNQQTQVSVTLLKPYLMSAFSHFLVHYLTDSQLCFIDMPDVADLVDHFADHPKSAVLGSPMHIISAKKYLPAEAEPTMFFSSGDFIYPNIIRELLHLYPMAVYHYVYGLAEIGGRFFVNSLTIDSDPESFHCLGSPINASEFNVKEDELFVKSQCQFFGYLKDGDFIEAQNYHPTGDLVTEENGWLALIGRKGDEIKVAGNKVSLKNLEQKASEAFLNDVLVFVPTVHEVLGTLIALVIYTEKQYSRREVITRLRQVLAPHEIPHKLLQIDTLPYTQTMKIDRKEIANQLSDLTPIL